jgi:hypothetical protein
MIVGHAISTAMIVLHAVLIASHATLSPIIARHVLTKVAIVHRIVANGLIPRTHVGRVALGRSATPPSVGKSVSTIGYPKQSNLKATMSVLIDQNIHDALSTLQLQGVPSGIGVHATSSDHRRKNGISLDSLMDEFSKAHARYSAGTPSSGQTSPMKPRTCLVTLTQLPLRSRQINNM